jgi:RimJ/RimL family protein N-acetyltransferase
VVDPAERGRRGAYPRLPRPLPERGATTLIWQTAKDNLRAQAVYERLGAVREEWHDYSLAV